jgi:repressor LexA
MSDLGNKEVFSKNLIRYMEINHVDRSEICKTIGVPYTTFVDWEKGKIYPRINNIEKLANYFSVAKSDLIEEKPSTEAKSLSKETMDIISRIDQLSPANRAKLSELIDLYLSSQDKK